MSDEFAQRAAELIDAGRFFYERGWVPATSGNFSARLADGNIAVTVSGKHKGRLTEADIMRVDADGQSLDGKKPSAETLLHTSIYRLFPAIGAVLHPHAPAATLLSRLSQGPIRLDNYELLKALPGIASHDVTVELPVFGNDQDIPALAGKAESYLRNHPETPAYLIASHGFYTWGATVADALRHAEALEFLFDLECRSSDLRRN